MNEIKKIELLGILPAEIIYFSALAKVYSKPEGKDRIDQADKDLRKAFAELKGEVVNNGAKVYEFKEVG